jgi:hypothetical protein
MSVYQEVSYGRLNYSLTLVEFCTRAYNHKKETNVNYHHNTSSLSHKYTK